jgi:hypothetical protein
MTKTIFYIFGVLVAFAFVYRKLQRLNELEAHRQKVDDYNKERTRELDKYIATIPTKNKIDSAMRRAERKYRDDSQE